MNEQEIENLLQKAPRVAPPADLPRKLRSEIALPRQRAEQPVEFNPQPWLKRWLPALSFAAFFLTCVVVLGIQAKNLAELKRQNAALRDTVADVDSLRQANAEFKQLKASAADLERLRADNADAIRLRAEVASLRNQQPEIERLRAENQKLMAANQARAIQSGAPAGDDPFSRAGRIQCVNNLKQIGLAGRIWAGDNNDTYPPDFLSMTNELANAAILLQCPGDKSRTVKDWSDVANGNVSYRMLAAGINTKAEPNHSIVFVICPIHNNVCLVDGSVQQLSPERASTKLKVVNGRTVLVE